MRRLCLAAAIALAAGGARGATFEEGLALKKQEKLAEAEQVFAEVVRDQPSDAAALEQWATLLGWLGRFDDSITAWTRALEQKPDDPDYLIGLARVQYWKGDLAPARDRLDALLLASPGNADALALAGDVCAAQRDMGCARERYLAAQAVSPSAELTRKLAASSGPPAWRFDAGGQLDGNSVRGVEGSLFVQASFRALAPLVISAGYEQLHQFGEVDHRLNAGAYLRPFAALVLNARVAISPTADTVGPWEASGGAELSLAAPVTALLNVRHLDFPAEGVTIVGGGARVDVGRLALIGQGGLVASTVNSLQGFGTGRVEYAIGDDWRVYAGLARGGQAQLRVAPAIATDIVAGVTWQVDRNFGLRLDYTYEAFGDEYVRNSLGSALTCKF